MAMEAVNLKEWEVKALDLLLKKKEAQLEATQARVDMSEAGRASTEAKNRTKVSKAARIAGQRALIQAPI